MTYDEMLSVIGQDRNTSVLLELSMELTRTMNAIYKRANYYSTTDPDLMRVIEETYDAISKLRMRLYEEKTIDAKTMDNMLHEIGLDNSSKV